MKLFQCQNCGQPLYFENTLCESCGLALGYLPTRETVTALRPDSTFRSMDAPMEGTAVSGRRYRYCANFVHGVCNWLVRVDRPEQFCAACRHNRTIPDLSVPENLVHWRMLKARSTGCSTRCSSCACRW